MQLTPPLGIFGGTFDPVHNGHLQPVIEAAQITKIEHIALLPCFIPSHKAAALASSKHRLKMLELVCAEHPQFFPDSRDIRRAKPTVSYDSLSELRLAYPTTPLCFFIGTDSLNQLTTWYKWQALFSLCHFVVCERFDQNQATTKSTDNLFELPALLKHRQVFSQQQLHNQLAGSIYLANTKRLDISSTDIRKRLTQGQPIDGLLPPSVVNYIHQHKLYQSGIDFC